jgi:UDP-glucose 4-epimerase
MNSLTGTKVLVLGGRGFLGRNLVDVLLRDGASVRTFDRQLSSSSTDQPAFKGKVEEFEGNFIDGQGLEAALDNVDLVYHLISTTVPSGSNADPIGDVTSNLAGTLRLLKAMSRLGVNRLVYASSGGTVYGNPCVLPVPEWHTLQPISSYGVVKVAVENYLHLHSELHGLQANVLRISNPYGMHQRRIGTQGVIATFLNKLVNGQTIEIWGDGSAVRDYIYVADVARALLLAGRREKSGTFNIGSGVGHSLNDVLRVLRNQTGLETEVRYLPHRKFDVSQTFLDIERAREKLGWTPFYTLEEGCARFCQLMERAREPALA